MITEISNIRDFGVFKSFSGINLPACSKFNLIFGWNYSGKTTLSRVFQSLQKSTLHPDYGSAKFLFKDNAGTSYDQTFSTPCNTRVFNEDFRRDNLRWDDAAGFEPIFILGSANIALQDELDRKNTEKATALAEKQKAEITRSELDTKLSQAQTDCGTKIARELSIPRFDKRNLKTILDGFNGIAPALLSDAEFQSKKAKALSNDQKGIIAPLPTTVATLTLLIEQTKGLIERQVISSALIQHLVDHPKTASWVEEGFKLHTSQSTCEFCQNTISKDRYAALNAHFSKGYLELKDALLSLSSDIEAAALNIDGLAYVKQNFYGDLHQEWSTLSSTLRTCLEARKASIDILKTAISQKTNNPFDAVVLPAVDDNSTDFSAALVAFNELIMRANERSNTFVATKNAAIEASKQNYAAEFAVAHKYFDAVKKLSDLKKEIDAYSEVIKALDIEILQLQHQLSDTVKGAEKVNSVLSHFFGKDDICVKVTDRNTFLLMRGEERAKNLSEGEKTAISFAYFMTKILENKNILADTIIYIDDPISSLDTNHLFNIYSFIKATFYKFDETVTPKQHHCLCCQLFISTHNLDFFHLIHDWYSKTKKDDHQFFMVERVDQGGVSSSIIKLCGDEIKKYKSEYIYLFGAIKRYLDNPSADIDIIFSLGNIMRRFVEGYLHFKYLTVNIDTDIGSLITNSVQCERARKFMHFHSHNLTRGGGLRVADIAEAKAVADIIFAAISNHDPIHFAALNAAI